MSQGEKSRARAVAVCYGTEVLSAEENRVPPDYMLFWGIGPWSFGAREKADDREEQKRSELKGNWEQTEGDDTNQRNVRGEQS